MIKVSLIIPVFNASKYIGRCLESIKLQTYRNLEVIFVEDCSTDDSLAKVKDFAACKEVNDLQIIILQHETNRGVAAARNTAMDAATGDYVYSLDADDYIDADTIALMVDEAQLKQADIVGIEWMMTFEKNGRHMHQPEVTTGVEMFRMMCHGVMRWNLWLFLIKRSLIEEQGLRFTEQVNMGEDMMLMMKLSLQAQKVSIIHKPLYYYVQVASSVSKVWSQELMDQITQNVSEVESFLEGKYKEEINCLKLNQKLPLLISSKKDDYKKWLNWFPEANDAIFQCRELSLRTKLIQYAAKKRQFWLLKLYYVLVIKFVYGVIYK